MKLRSSEFAEGGSIPPRFTGDGADVSPPLSWSELPDGTKSLALIVDDPDAPDPAHPRTTWVHWVVYDIPASAHGIDEGKLPAPAREGLNDWKNPGWGGPSPPIGRHRYVFKLYALDAKFPQLSSCTKARLEQAMSGHVLAEARLTGTYARAGH